jgi:hypothetical protein
MRTAKLNLSKCDYYEGFFIGEDKVHFTPYYMYKEFSLN